MPLAASAELALAAARGGAGKGLRIALALQIIRTLLRLAFAASLALLAGKMITAGVLDAPALAGALMALLAGSIAGVLADRATARTEADVCRALLRQATHALNQASFRAVAALPQGAVLAGLQRYPLAVAELVVGHALARSMLAAGPLLAAAALLLVSWQAALALILTTPILVGFFVLIGSSIEAAARSQERAFGQLAAQFADRIRTLPSILGFGALDREQAKLSQRLDRLASGTLKVLRIAFLNAGVIDLVSSLSIAMLAVLLGLGHLGLADIPGFAGLALWQSLLILIIAPEYFAPFRRYAEQYHTRAAGLAAATALDQLFASLASNELPAIDTAKDGAATLLDRSNLPSRGLVAITGRSGSGKSTLLRRLAGLEEPRARSIEAPGIAWCATDILVSGGTVGEAISWPSVNTDSERVRKVAEAVGLRDDRFLPQGLQAATGDGGAFLSGGQRMRIGLARALLGDGPIFADEPTAKLDPATAARVRLALAEAARTRLVLVATHDPALVALAERVVDLDAGASEPQGFAA